MTPPPIAYKIMWACFKPSGEIIFDTIASTKKESIRLLKVNSPYVMFEKHTVSKIAIDIEPIK